MGGQAGGRALRRAQHIIAYRQPMRIRRHDYRTPTDEAIPNRSVRTVEVVRSIVSEPRNGS